LPQTLQRARFRPDGGDAAVAAETGAGGDDANGGGDGGGISAAGDGCGGDGHGTHGRSSGLGSTGTASGLGWGGQAGAAGDGGGGRSDAIGVSGGDGRTGEAFADVEADRPANIAGMSTSTTPPSAVLTRNVASRGAFTDHTALDGTGDPSP
jgi:hypothetical protein